MRALNGRAILRDTIPFFPALHPQALKLAHHSPLNPRRILTKLDGVTAIETNVGAKSVVVTVAEGSSTTKEVLLEALQKWGKAASKSVELDESA